MYQDWEDSYYAIYHRMLCAFHTYGHSLVLSPFTQREKGSGQRALIPRAAYTGRPVGRI
jgi:hypothetical protein